MNELIEQNSKPNVAASSKRTSKDSGKDPPPLSAADALLLKGVGESVVRMLTERKIDTNVYSSPGDEETPQVLKVNEQNVRNRAREVLFNGHIQK